MMQPQPAIRAAGRKSPEAASQRVDETTATDKSSRSRRAHENGNPPESDAVTLRIDSVISLVQHAYSRLLDGDTKEARRSLEHALACQGCRTPSELVTTSAGTQSLQHAGLDASSSPRELAAEQPTRGVMPVVIRTLGTFEVLVDGEAPGAKRKPPHLLLGILKVLIANGGCSVNRSLLLDVLWPDLDGDRASDAQQVALHRLRRLLCHPDALVINHGYISLNTQIVEVDAFILDTLCRNPFITGNHERASAALNLYRGTFLPDELDSPWSQRMRECMRAKFVNIVAAAGKELEAKSDFGGAASLYEKALTVDDLENIIREGLVRALRREKASKGRARTNLN